LYLIATIGMKLTAVLLLLLPAGALCRERHVLQPESHVNTLGGTQSRPDLSHGNLLPLVARPWGFNSWSPYTDVDASHAGWWFHPDDRHLYGVRCTHQPSPWIGDYGQFGVSASITDPQHAGPGQSSAYVPDDAKFSPSYFQADLLAYTSSQGVPTSLEVTPSKHGAVFRVTFPKYEDESGSGYVQTRQIMVWLNGGGDSSQLGAAGDGTTLITGKSTKNSGGVSPGVDFAHYFAAAIYAGPDGDVPISHTEGQASSTYAFASFDPLDPLSAQLTVRIATSFISADQALLNLRREVGTDKTFEDVWAESRQEWDGVLSRVDVKAPAAYSLQAANDLYTRFYTAVYRASLFPRDLSEVDGTGAVVHWSPYTAVSPQPGVLSSDSGFWDAYSTVYPYLSLVNRPVLGGLLQGWVNAYSEGGWLPKWASPGYRGSMVGTMGDVTLADAIVKGIPGFDVETAWEAIRKDAYEAPPKNSSGVGRVCLAPYLEYGYVPKNAPMATGGDCDEVLSRTLLYLQADYAMSQAAAVLGKAGDAADLAARAQKYGMIFDGASTGMMRSIDIDTGKFSEPFDQFAWGGDYTEAGPWQYRFHMPYDPQGLSDLFAANSMNICDELTKAQTGPGVFHIGAYSDNIHEQTEFVENCWGQYAHNNQPVHHMLYMFGASDAEGYTGSCAAAGQHYLRQAQLKLYTAGNDMFSGDEDNGQMSAWFILSSFGLYSLSPGDEEYVFGSPLFETVSIPLDNGNYLVISSVNNSEENSRVERVTWNGNDFAAGVNGIKYSELMKGGELKFYMGPNDSLRY
jgi:predicted alpha-1,2-mannosidase